MKRTVNFFKTEQGLCPVAEFLDSLSAKHAQKVIWVLQLIEELPVLPRQYFKKIVGSDDIWEVRIQQGNNIFRLLGFFFAKDLYP